jgi:hypothetical protein
VSLPNKIASLVAAWENVDGGLHNISRADAVGVVGGRVMMRDGAIRHSGGIELGLRHDTMEGERISVPLWDSPTELSLG